MLVNTFKVVIYFKGGNEGYPLILDEVVEEWDWSDEIHMFKQLNGSETGVNLREVQHMTYTKAGEVEAEFISVGRNDFCQGVELGQRLEKPVELRRVRA